MCTKRIRAKSRRTSRHNPYYTDIYKHKFMALRNSILASEGRDAIVNKKYKPSEISELKPWELERDGRYAQTMEERIHLELRKELAKEENKNVEGFFHLSSLQE